MTALDFARWQGAVAGLLLGALAGALMEEAGIAGNATVAVVLALIGGLLGHRAGERLHRRRLRLRADRLAEAADGGGSRAPESAAASVESLEAVLADLEGLRDDAAPSHARVVAAVTERAEALTGVFDLLVRERRLILEPGVSAPVDDALAAAVARRFEAFCDRAALDGVPAGPEMADYVAAAVDRRVVELDPFREPAGAAAGDPDGPQTAGAGAGAGADGTAAAGAGPRRSAPRGPWPEALSGGGLETAVLRTLLVLLAQVEAVRRTADRATRDPAALRALADLKRSATAGTALLLGRPSPWYVQRWFPTVAAG